MSINDQCGVATFTPHGTFRRLVIYNLTIQGIDLSNVDPETVKFVYMADNGKYYPADCDAILVNKHSGRIQVVNARLPNFSRYGFVN